MNDGSMRRILGFSRTEIAESNSDIWLLGACYRVYQDDGDANSSCSDPTQNDGYAAFIDDSSSQVHDNLFLFVEAFLIHKLGRSWRKSPQKPFDQSYIEILHFFGDSEDSPYSIHNLLQAGKAYGLALGS